MCRGIGRVGLVSWAFGGLDHGCLNISVCSLVHWWVFRSWGFASTEDTY